MATWKTGCLLSSGARNVTLTAIIPSLNSMREAPMKHGIWQRIKRKVGKLLRTAAYLSILYASWSRWLSGTAGMTTTRVACTIYVVNDITELNPVPMSRVLAPRSTEEIVAAIKTSSGPVSIGGGRFSMGGQTAIDNGLQLDMRDYDQVVAFFPERTRDHRPVRHVLARIAGIYRSP